MIRRTRKNSEGGVATIEFAITAGFFLLMIVAVVAGGHLFWTHNALVDATRRGARYAANNCNPSDNACPGFDTVITRIKNVVLYNNPNGGSRPFVPNLQASQIVINYSVRPGSGDSRTFGVGEGSVSVKIQGYNYDFVLSPTAFPMPPYETTVYGESAGYEAESNVCP